MLTSKLNAYLSMLFSHLRNELKAFHNQYVSSAFWLYLVGGNFPTTVGFPLLQLGQRIEVIQI